MKNEKRKYPKTNTHNIFVLLSSFLFLLFSFASCNEPVFFAIYSEVEIQPPKIQGSPTDFIEIGGKMYVASGNVIYAYNIKDDKWDDDTINPNKGRITYLAGANNKLYILADNKLYESSNPDDADSYAPITIPGHTLLSMYSANNQIFLGSRKTDDNYSILHFDGTALNVIVQEAGQTVALSGKEITTKNGLLKGVAYNATGYFFCVKDQVTIANGGIYHFDGANAFLIGNYDIPFIGIVSIDNTNIYAINRNNGDIYEVTSSSITKTNFSAGRYTNGTMFVWKDPNSANRLLLAGIQDNFVYTTNSGFNYGYLEIELESSAIKNGSSFREPGVVSPSTLETGKNHKGRGHNERYNTTLGTNPVKFLYQSNEIIFASTQQAGVWSLRDRGESNKEGNWIKDIYWNSEE